jgi:hypothetical protein
MLGAYVKLSVKIEIWIASGIEIIVFWLRLSNLAGVLA